MSCTDSGIVSQLHAWVHETRPYRHRNVGGGRLGISRGWQGPPDR